MSKGDSPSEEEESQSGGSPSKNGGETSPGRREKAYEWPWPSKTWGVQPPNHHQPTTEARPAALSDLSWQPSSSKKDKLTPPFGKK